MDIKPTIVKEGKPFVKVDSTLIISASKESNEADLIDFHNNPI